MHGQFGIVSCKLNSKIYKEPLILKTNILTPLNILCYMSIVTDFFSLTAKLSSADVKMAVNAFELLF